MKSRFIPEIKKILRENNDRILRIKFDNGDVFVLEIDAEVDPSTYGEDGTWLCWIVEAIQGAHHEFHKLFQKRSGLDIRECDVKEIIDEENGITLYG